MKRNFLPAIGAAAVAAVLVVGCREASKEPPPGAPHEKAAEAESRVKRGTNGEVIITLDSETQKVMGLQTAPLSAASLSPETNGYGHVLDPAPLSSLVAELVSARATTEASQKELERLKVLAAQNNASVRSVQTAEAASLRDQVSVELARQHLLTAWGKAIADRADLLALVQSLAAAEFALVRIDLPAGDVLKAQPAGARLFALADESSLVAAEYVGPAPAVDTQMQGQGFLFLAKSGQSRFAPGAAVTGFLQLPGATQLGVVLPRNALVRFNGATWVYLQTANDTFQRTEAILERSLDAGWFVREGLKAGDKVVVVGAQQLLSEELKGQIGE